ncbi:MAG: phosphotransferase [Solirubrobacterales bacterium]|nr:phosphotransferase [Solirubrobacterales bacterium]
MSGELRLPEGLGGMPVWRSDRGVHRPTGAWTPTVHAFLRHLEAAGYDGSPRIVGTDETGREILTFIEGEVLAAGSAWQPGDPTPWPEWARTEECLAATAGLMRGLHDAAATFEPPDDAVWRRYPAPSLGADQCVCHGDIGPHNTVYRDGIPVAFIDWDTIRPNDPIVEFGAAAWKYIPLGNDDHFAASDFPSRPALARRLAVFANAYDIDDRDTVAWALHQAKQRSVEALRYFPVTPAQGADELHRIAAELEWLDNSIVELCAEIE